MAGAFVAFFAFIGFETMANLGEEVKEPASTLPRAILIAVVVSAVLYVAVAWAAVASGAGGDVPLLSLFEGRAVPGFAAVGAIAIANGVLVEIIMLSRLFYGMASKRQLPAVFARIDPRTQTPVLATLAAGSIIVATALVAPFERLLVWANVFALLIFVTVDLALWKVHATQPRTGRHFSAPRWVPPVAAGLAVALIVGEVLF
jgi:amino acid transporter